MSISATWKLGWTDHYDVDEPCLHLNEETELVRDDRTGLMLSAERVQYIMVIREYPDGIVVDGEKVYTAPAMHRLVLGDAARWGGMEYPPFVLNGLYDNGQHSVCVGYLQEYADHLRSIGLAFIENSTDAQEYTARSQENIDREIRRLRGQGGVEL